MGRCVPEMLLCAKRCLQEFLFCSQETTDGCQDLEHCLRLKAKVQKELSKYN